MTETLLISEAKVRQFSDINDNLDSSLINNAIREAGDIHLQRIIGTKLYKKIIADVEAGTITGVYKALLDDYMQDFLLYAAYYETLEAVYLKPRNAGLLVSNGNENSTAADRTLYNQKRTSVQSKMEFYGDRLSSYLSEEQQLFPELNTNNKAYEQGPDYSSQYRSPIVFNSKGKRGAYYKEAKKAGLRITDSKYNQYPWGSNID